MLDRGDTPALAELRLHNGTIYRWNRPVYDVVRGRPHLRVENRVLPAGPTVVDMMANAAFYFGLVRALAEDERPLWTQMSFSAAEENFHAGARHGIDARRCSGRGSARCRSTELVLRRLLPLAHEGLDRWGVDAAGAGPAAGHHRAALPDRPQRRDLAGRRRSTAVSKRIAWTASDALREMLRRYSRAHARQHAGARVAGRLNRFVRRRTQDNVGQRVAEPRSFWRNPFDLAQGNGIDGFRTSSITTRTTGVAHLVTALQRCGHR